jgi:hypothetical protein
MFVAKISIEEIKKILNNDFVDQEAYENTIKDIWEQSS